MHSEGRKIIFLDRDGVVNRERGDFTWRLEDFILNDDLFEALKILKENKYEFIVISNQSGIGRGLYKFEDVEFLHHQLYRTALANSITFLEIYYCPHHPDQSKCICRKPDSLMLEKALARFSVDLNKSWFIGDAERDAEAAHKVGLNSIRLPSNSSLLSILPQILK